jgi:hypothetical protein
VEHATGLGVHVPKPQPRRRRTGSASGRPVRIAGGYKVFDEGKANEELFYGLDVVQARYHEVAPRGAPRIHAPSSIPPPHVHKMRDADARSFGALSSRFWPGTEFTRREEDFEGGSAHWHERPPSTDGRRYEGVTESDFYDPIVRSGSQHSWQGSFGGPFHPWEGGYSRQLSRTAHVG